MSGSYRGDGTTHLGGFGILLAILLSAVIVGGLAYIEGYQGEARQNRAHEYQEAAKRNALIACANGEPAAVADCVYNEINSARDQAESQQDLDAQQWMARWAGILTILTGATTVISWFALRYLRDTFRQTATAADAATGATKAMIEANRIAANAQRPWLTINLEPYDGVSWSERGMVYDILITIKNVGHSAAIGVKVENQATPLDGGAAASQFFDDCNLKAQHDSTGDILAPGEIREVRTNGLVPRDTFPLVHKINSRPVICPHQSVSVTYCTIDNAAILQTGRCFALLRSKKESPGTAFAFFEDEGPVDKQMLAFNDIPWGVRAT
jgi:hypothetical protein